MRSILTLADGGNEDDGGHLVEAVDPLAPLVALATHIIHAEAHVVNDILLLCGHDVIRRVRGEEV